MKAKKKVMITHESVDLDTVELSVITLAIDFPKFENKRYLYRYELCDCLMFLSEILIEEALNPKNSYTIDDFFLLPISEQEFEDITDFLSEKTVYEEVLFNSEYKILNAIIEQKKKDPKFWEV